VEVGCGCGRASCGGGIEWKQRRMEVSDWVQRHFGMLKLVVVEKKRKKTCSLRNENEELFKRVLMMLLWQL